MKRYILIRRLWAPAYVLLVGVIALLAQAGILGWSQSWPLYLILAGVLMLAERAALAADGYPQSQGVPNPAPNPAAPVSAANPASVPGEPENFGDHQSGAQS
jgi:hypothetical protein